MKQMFFIWVLMSFVLSAGIEPPYRFFEPNHYIRIERNTVEFLRDQLNYPVLYQQYDPYQILFQKEPIDTILKPPYILVQINKREWISKSDLIDFSKQYYKLDSATNYLWRYQEDKLNVIIPTNEGTLNIYCFSEKGKFDEEKAAFENFISDIKINEKIKYKNTFLRDNKFTNFLFYRNGRVMIFLLFAFFVAGIFSVIISKKSLKKKKEE